MMNISTNRLRVTMLLFAFAAGLALASLGILGTLSAQAAEGEQVKEADVVVQFDDHDVIIRPITFTGEISGLRALELSGLDIITATFSWGQALCAIERVGCPADPCFCPDGVFWGNSYWGDGTWTGYPIGAADTVISKTGAVDGWRWGTGDPPAPAPDVQAAQSGLDWLQEKQSMTDGSYGGNVSSSLDVLLAIGANHMSADEWRQAPDAPSLMGFVTYSGAGYSRRGVSESGKLGAAVSAADGCWPSGATVWGYLAPFRRGGESR